MLEYMRKHQTLEPIDEKVVDRATMPFVGEYHGTSGPVRTSFNETYLPIEHDWIKACDEVTGYVKKPTDPWSGDHIGFYNTLGLVARTGPNKGKRSYAARGYFASMSADRPNLHVLCEATVTAIDLDGDKATGVSFSYGGKKHTVKTNREVIVSCGALQSPQILELSGIGDPDVLKAAGVECKVENRAVGANFQDHSLTVKSSMCSGKYSMLIMEQLAIWELEPGVLSNEVVYQPEVSQSVRSKCLTVSASSCGYTQKGSVLRWTFVGAAPLGTCTNERKFRYTASAYCCSYVPECSLSSGQSLVPPRKGHAPAIAHLGTL
jgi:choline dehydrogenase-like flavoprotein